MAPDCPASCVPGPLERPTGAAQLKIKAERGWGKAGPRRWITEKGTVVPPAEARHFISTLGIVGSVVTSTAAAVLTLRITPRLASIALAELVLGLAAAVLIAACGRDPRGERIEEQAPHPGQPGSACGESDIMTS